MQPDKNIKIDLKNDMKLIQIECHKIAVSKGWWEEVRSDGELIALMHSELSEALEGLRHNDMENVAEELADTVIRIMDYCEDRGIELCDEVKKKMEKNRGRSYKHGGKKF